MMTRILFFFVFLGFYYCQGQERIPLYSGLIPNSKQVVNQEEDRPNAEVDTLTFNVSIPSITVFLPPKEKANGTAVIILPGGGYHVLLSKREGSDVAKAFNEIGVAAFVLRYRLPNEEVLIDKTIGPLQDAQQAIKLIREHAQEWGIDSGKVGIIGFSAGGHLAASAGTHFDSPMIKNIDGVNLRPDFMLLINPVISFRESIGHIGSRDNLLGQTPSEEKIRYFSNELHVNAHTPPTFLVHTGTDKVVSVENSIVFYEALKKNKVTAELHIYSKGEHGFLTWPYFGEWFGRCVNWMEGLSLLNSY